MKLKFIAVIALQLFGKTLSQSQNVKCSQIDFMYYDSQCCDSSNDVSCLKQISKIDYESTIGDLQKQINDISKGALRIEGSGNSLGVTNGASLDVESNTEQDASVVTIGAKSKLVMKADSVLDVSAIKVSHGKSSDLRSEIDYVQLSDVTGKDGKIVMDSALHADKGLTVDGDKFVVADVSGSVSTKGDVVALGGVKAGTLDINGKLRVGVDGVVESHSNLLVKDSEIRVMDGVVSKIKLQKDGRIDASGKIIARKGLKVLGEVASLGFGLNVNNMLTVSATGDVIARGKIDLQEGASIGGDGKNSELRGTTTVPLGDTLVINGELNVLNGKLITLGSIAARNVSFDVVTSDLDMKNHKVKNAKVEGQFDGKVGETSPSSVKATTLSSSSLATLASVDVAGEAKFGSVSVNDNKISNVTTLSVEDLTASGAATVSGATSLKSTLSVTGATTLDSAKAASLEVDGETTLKGSASMEKDVTFKQKIIVEEQMQIGTGASRTIMNTTVATASKSLTLVPNVGQCVTNTVAVEATTPETALPILNTILAQGGACKDNSNVYVAAKTTQASCASPNTWFAVASISNVVMNTVYTQICSAAPTAGGGDQIYSYGDGTPTSSKKCKTVFAKKSVTGKDDADDFITSVFAEGGACLNATTGNVHSSFDKEVYCPIGYAWRPTGVPNTPPTLVALKSDNNELQICVGDQVMDDASFTLYNLKDVVGGAVDFVKDGALKTSGKATLASLEVEGDSKLANAAALVITMEGLKTSGDSFSVSSSGDIKGKDLTLTGEATIEKAVNMLDSLKVVKAAEMQTSLSVKQSNSTDAVVIDASDASVSAKIIKSSGTISGKDDLFKVSDAGVVSAEAIVVPGHGLPMFQESAAAKCTKADGVIMFAEGSCDKSYRKWTCTVDGGSNVFTGQDIGDTSMGSCAGTLAAVYVDAASTDDVCVTTGTQPSQFCEALETRKQCEGIASVGQDVPTQTKQTWSPKGSVELRLCQDSNLIALPAPVASSTGASD